MKKKLVYVMVFAGIILLGLVIQAKSSLFYPEAVIKVEQVTHEGNKQTLTGTLLNRSGQATLETDYHENEGVHPLYRPGEQLIIRKLGSQWQVLSLKRDGYVFMLLALFVWLVLLISGKGGISALLGLALNSFLLVGFLWLHQASQWSLLGLMSVYTVVAVIVAMGTSYGFRNLDVRKLLGTLLSVFLAFFICLLAMHWLKDDGLRYEELQFITRPYRSVFLGGLLIGAIGASMDNVVTIISSLDEIREKNPQLPLKQLLHSGQQIAQDTASSMINVLMFAYLSGAIPAFVFYIANGWNFADVMGMHLSLEILRTLCGGFAIVLSVPLALAAFGVAEGIQERRPTK
ncbi:YibE/F family protein [Enterococcus devriesei]|uniref:YibE/F family protein n=1 Tax=Enterococcus devriesei TaxID=319970 RepID=UPI001C107BAE|nr:YibE/F family protein [Enterococcus devriesei]MBU5366158.1 YibE/F family protein [Enterococcus devriesei]MDT2821727.1 YibE/F family protein [Enterococcus devriesei]